MFKIAIFFVSVVLCLGLNTAMATHFDGCGTPYCGCGVPQSLLGTNHFLALNVQKTPNDYTTYLVRPIQDSSKVGAFNNGGNCGRWIKVTLGRYCTGVNSGIPGHPFCEGGQWVSDNYTGATLNFIVADSCQDGNRWCRDDTYHTDLSTASLKEFDLHGQKVDVSGKWNNREVMWDYIAGPTNSIKLYFGQHAQQYYPVIIITGFQDGLSGVEENNGGTWSRIKRVSDEGQSYLLNNGVNFEIRLLDINGKIINSRTYKFGFPSSCPNNKCGDQPAYPIAYGNQEVHLES
jgi:hypothetical protein